MSHCLVLPSHNVKSQFHCTVEQKYFKMTEYNKQLIHVFHLDALGGEHFPYVFRCFIMSAKFDFRRVKLMTNCPLNVNG